MHCQVPTPSESVHARELCHRRHLGLHRMHSWHLSVYSRHLKQQVGILKCSYPVIAETARLSMAMRVEAEIGERISTFSEKDTNIQLSQRENGITAITEIV